MPEDSKGTILYVEDNPDNRSLIRRVLNSEDYAVVEAINAAQAINKLETESIDLILMDIRLPYEDGYSALKKIRLSPRIKNVPVIAVTAEGTHEQINRARTAGFNGFIGKPLDPDKFPEQIQRILNGEDVWEISYEER